MAEPKHTLFGFHDVVLPQQASLLAGMNGPIEEPAPTPAAAVPVPECFYAVTMPLKGGAVKVLEYEHTEEGHRQLTNLIRGEKVIKVIFGRAVAIEAASVVDLELDGTVITDRLPLPE